MGEVKEGVETADITGNRVKGEALITNKENKIKGSQNGKYPEK
jgi:hypothetical protein